MKPALPVEAALPALRAALGGHGSAVLEAPPGAGKSTVVPLALLGEEWAAGKRLVVLEPRRIAARAVAQRMAATRDEQVGGTVGYRMRLETRVSRGTRIEVVTQGVLTRMLQRDPALEGVAAVVFDEFHERSLEADLGLALCIDARAQLAPHLRILVMSATLDGAAVAQLLGGAPRVSIAGEGFPVATHYAGRGAPLLAAAGAADAAEQLVARLTRRALREAPGDLLVFLPGAREIRRVQALLESGEGAGALPPEVRVTPLFGDLTAGEQDVALAPAAAGTRKVVLATNIAETSLTLPGVRVVVDCGLARRARFDPATGMGRLETVRISRASAEQRRGRAGRLAPGVCYRAWSEGAHASLAPFTPPEITEADLAPLALELAGWGVRDVQSLLWLDAPPAAMLAQARELLMRLAALGSDGRITAHGRDMARLPLHPRLGHMLLKARDLDTTPLAARLAALLSERDLLRGGAGARDADVRTRLDLLEDRHAVRAAGRTALDRAGLERVRRTAADLERQLPGRPARRATRDSGAEPGTLLAFAYPDRIGRRRAGGEGRFTLANGRGAVFAAPQALARSEFVVAVDVDDRERDARILLAAPLERGALLEQFSDRIREVDAVAWSAREQAVTARRTLLLDALVLEEQPLADADPQAVLQAMLAGIRELGIGALPWDRACRDLQARVAFVRGRSAWPELSDTALTATLDTWLAPWLGGVTRREQLARLPLAQALAAQLSFEQQRALERDAPTHLTVPSGSRIRIDYRGEGAPAVEVRLQEVFGLEATPTLGPGHVPVTFRLLSPAQRPVQVTRDLASFWRGAYAEVRKQLRGRYPRHYWPEDPLAAHPTRAVRRRH